MINVEFYMNDGANWQAQAVLAYIRSHKSHAVEKSWNEKFRDYEVDIVVGRYENCREQGYVFTIRHGGKQKNYAVYEHRNSDAICVLISNTLTMNTPGIDDMWKDKGENPSKYDYDKDFPCGDTTECGEYIINDIWNTLAEWYEK